jgi:hypothetical protein
MDFYALLCAHFGNYVSILPIYFQRKQEHPDQEWYERRALYQAKP